jgi:hypothetical protein
MERPCPEGSEMTRSTIASVLEAMGVLEGSIDTLIESMKTVLDSKFDNFTGGQKNYTYN